MKNSKIIFLFNILLFIFLFVYLKNYHYISLYNDEKEIIGIVTKIEKKDDNVKIILKAKEKILLNCYSCKFGYKIGSIVKFKGYFQDVVGRSNFNIFDYKNYLLSMKIYKNFIFNECEYIKDSNNIIYDAYNNLTTKIERLKSSYFLKAMILGNTQEFGDIYESYKTNGIVHLFAISGMHVGIISSILTFILKKFFKLNNIAYLIIFPVLIFYMLIINTASIIRSVLMFIIMSSIKLFKIKLSNLNVLIYLIVLNLFINPYIIYNNGFCLTYIIAFFLTLASKKLANVKNYFLKLLLISVISFLASFPLVINNNFEFNLLTPIINIFIVPFVTLILFPISLLTLIFPIFDNILIYLLNGFDLLNIFLSNNSIIINVSYIKIYLVVIYYLILIAYLINNKHIYLLLFYFIFIINIKNLNFNSYLIMIDVGQGDSIFIKNYFGENILLDAGSKESSAKNIIIPYLKSIGIKRIDKFIISHGDKDHIVGALDIINTFDVEEVYLNSYKNTSYEEEIIKYRKVNLISENKYINKHLYLMNYYSANENDDSLITYLVDYKILCMGDASSKIEKNIDIQGLNILKVGHHGSKTSTSKEFVKKVKPKISLISVGLKNKYNHPSKEAIGNLKDSLIFMTSKNGMIKVNLKNYKVETYY